MSLFDKHAESIGTRPRGYAEATFEYYNRSGRKSVREMCNVLEEWFSRYPGPGKADLLGRFRSVSENQHSSALLELVLHEALSQAGYEIELHPDLDGNTAHPDFLVSKTGASCFYMEATAACEANARAAKQRRIDQVHDTLNDLDSADFFLGIESAGGPDTAPPGRQLRSKVGEWLKTLDWQAVKTAGEQGRKFPKFKWEHEGWSIVIEALPKTEEARGRGGVRPIGITMGQPEWLCTDLSIKRVIEKKDRYGLLPLPFVVVVNVREDFCDDIDVFGALLGKEKFNFGPRGACPAGRVPDGAWVGKAGPIHSNVSAVLIFRDFAAATFGNVQFWFVHNPWALRHLDPAALPLTQYVPDASTGKFEKRAGISFGQALRLPEPWPPTDD
ncbi:MAG: hypothetical protein ACYDDI_07330 [Candidatus Acidiferrales bacterium]